MTTLLKLDNAYKHYGEQILLDAAEAEFTDDHKVGLIGRNGAGKSTLMRVLLGEEELDKGEVSYHPRLRLGYLRQHDPFQEGETVLDFLMRDSQQPDWKCGAMADQFEIKGPQLEASIRSLSGGWQTRVKLTALLLHEPNLLLLDEPTNFLDLRTQLLLEDFLKDFRGGAIVVSHDRTFLNDVCDHTISLSRGKLTLYPGNVDGFLAFQEEQRKTAERTNATVKAKMEQLETFIAKKRAHAATASQAKNKQMQLDRLQLIEIDKAEKTVRLKVPNIEPRFGPALRCEDLSIGYPERVVASNIAAEIEHGTRVAVVGDNGQGKTTFLRTVAASLEPLHGNLKWSFGCDIGCYAQHVYTTLPPHYTVREYLSSKATSDATQQTVLDMAGSFLFRGDDVDKEIAVLSGGERARLCLAGLLLDKFNILILDEPGNHLDVETVEALAEGLNRYKGTVIFTSHDRSFLERMATSVIEVRDGSVTNYAGSYADYLYRVKKEVEAGHRDQNAAKAAGPKAVVEETEQSKAERKARNRRIFDLRTQFQSADRQLNKYTEKKKTIETELETADPQKAKLLRDEHIALVEKLADIEERWLSLQQQLEKEEKAGSQ